MHNRNKLYLICVFFFYTKIWFKLLLLFFFFLCVICVRMRLLRICTRCPFNGRGSRAHLRIVSRSAAASPLSGGWRGRRLYDNAVIFKSLVCEIVHILIIIRFEFPILFIIEECCKIFFQRIYVQSPSLDRHYFV